MPLPPANMLALLASVAPVCSRPVWRQVPILLAVGTIRAPGRRMVSTVLRAVGLS